MKPLAILVWGAVSTLLLSCGGDLTASSNSLDSSLDVLADSAADSILVDSLVESAVDSADAGEAFCQGQAKYRHGGKLLNNFSVTTAPLFLNCCEAAMARIHTKTELGFDLEIMFRAQAAQFVAGTYDLSTPPTWLDIRIRKDQEGAVFAGMTGSLEIKQDSWDNPIFFSLCGTLQKGDGGTGLDGDQVFFDDLVVAPQTWNNRFSLWLLKDTSITADKAKATPIDSLELADSPILGVSGFGYYQWSAHSIQWETASSKYFFATLPNVGVYGLPFVVQADGQRVYLGSFWTPVSSVMPSLPFVMVDTQTDGGITIEAPPQGKDERGDSRVKKALEESGKLAP